MNDILLNILSVIVSAVVLPLISIAGTSLIKWINSKVKDQEANMLLNEATTIVINAVRNVMQTYVDSLKASGDFDSNAQVIALNKAKEIAQEQMNDKLSKFIETHYGDLSKWLTTQIEATINILKSKDNK